MSKPVIKAYSLILTTFLFTALFWFNAPIANASTLWQDSFTGTNDTNVESYNGTVYDDFGGSTIQSNKLHLQGDVKVQTYNQADGCISVDGTFPANNFIALSMRSDNNYRYYTYFYNTHVAIYVDQTNLADTPNFSTLSSGEHALKFCMQGGNLTAYIDGLLVASAVSTTYSSSGAYYMYAANETVDNLHIRTY